VSARQEAMQRSAFSATAELLLVMGHLRSLETVPFNRMNTS